MFINKKRTFEGDFKHHGTAPDEKEMIVNKKRSFEGEFKYYRAAPYEKLEMVCGAVCVPELNALKPDAHFLCPEKQAIGVADGGSAWPRKGVVTGEYAQELMNNSFIAVNRLRARLADPARILKEAFMQTQAKGSSTACIVMLKGNILHSINVGNSGFMIFRANRLVYKSPTQQHYFSVPYQLGKSESSDGLSSAKELRFVVLPGDIIVLGTDGLLDNVYPKEIENLLEEETSDGVDSQELAARIALDLALTNSLEHELYTPFARAAYAEGEEHNGGKIDDITVVVAHIVAQN